MTRHQPLIALVGNPNAGKSALFNALTGARQKIANYPGVTVERKSGRFAFADGRPAELIDLPGSYSLDPTSPDEAVTRDVVMGRQAGERQPDALVIVLDSANLDQHLVFALELLALGLPTVVALNMVDLAERDGLTLDAERLAADLGVPVIPTVAVRRRGLTELAGALDAVILAKQVPHAPLGEPDMRARRRRAEHIANAAIVSQTQSRRWTDRADAVLLHPFAGPLILFALLFVIFQAVFSWASPFADALEAGAGALSELATAAIPEGFFRSLVVDGAIAGVGAVVVFLPQIVILFFFILMMEATGYMARAAFIMDRLMASVGLSGRSFIPLLSSFACAIPGIMATRSISDEKDRLTTILIAPLMTCSARLPVYTVIIAAFIPEITVGPGVGLQGLVLFGLYVFGIIGAMVVALVLRSTVAKGGASGFLMEMPKYQMPRIADLALGLWQRAWLFLRRAGTIIFAVTIGLWLLLSYPQVPPGSSMSQSEYSAAGRIASVLEPVVAPIGFSRDIALALIPAMAAREVAVSALATTYAIDATDEDEQAQALGERLAGRWSLPTALAFLAWFVFAPQCISTIAVTRRETNGWKWPMFMVGYLFGLAWIAAGITFWTATAFGL
ncbi:MULTISPECIES: ferrous iron transporter B [Pseudomonadota]|jgi:ferrous iron transport protein B|uniref:ferrous iron transporter B n=2 Tax=Pseudomonadota TaxID=1224 RepID=UPI00076AC34C|nr:MULTISPECIES: ferrous iron transporter B [Pseudomonadota]MAF60097.1 ferrous iron transporter B [Blastomonas sp.]|tara:strand:+ start:28477 stop:30333 length:1857 start_codon:yes stop_codon:yes gene_type:complete